MNRIAHGLALLFAVTASSLPEVARALAQLPAEDGVKLAYIDPGSGSFILQALVAALAGAAVAVTSYWNRIKRFFGVGAAKTTDDEVEGTKPHDG
jgi:hypothetical protein